MKRWPIIRHIRYYYYVYKVNQHYDMWRDLGYLPVYVQHDIDALNEIWSGKR